jgi:serine/threonine protein kinase/tetratricopeptide (TPR) repeat protein
MSTVWRGWDVRLRVWRAIKVLDARAHPELRARFEREARAMARLHHRYVLPVHDVIEKEGSLLLVLELAPGGSLADRVTRHGPLSPALAARTMVYVLEALEAAHRDGVVHRDVKPHNILLARDGTPLVSDFGIARVLADEGATRTGLMFGTPAFAAPEQRRDAASVDARADVYSAGATLWYLVTGLLPWEVDRQEAEEWVEIGIPSPLASAISRATRYAPEDRYPSADAMREGLLEALLYLPEEPDHPLVPEDLPTFPPPPDELQPRPEIRSAPSLEAQTWREDAPPARDRRGGALLWGMLLGGLLAAALTLVVLRPSEPGDYLAPDHVPRITEDRELQTSFEQAWEAFLREDTDSARERLATVQSALPDQVLPVLLDSVVLGFDGDTPRSIEATRRASSLAEQDPDQPGVELARAVRRAQDQGNDQPLARYLEENGEDWLGWLFVSRYCSDEGEAACTEAHQRLVALDGSPLVAYSARAEAWMDLGQTDRAREVARAALADWPDAALMHALLARASLAEGDALGALAAASVATRLDPTLSLRTLLAKAALLGGTPDLPARLEELRSPSLPVSDRISAELTMAELYAGLGRVQESFDCLARARHLEETEGTPLGVIDAISRRRSALMLLEQPYVLALQQEQVEIAARAPEVPGQVRNRLTASLVGAQGRDAAARGDRAGVVEALERLALTDVPIPYLIEPLQRELAVLDRDAERLEQLDQAGFYSDCTRHATLAQALQRAGSPERARARWEKVLTAGCVLHTDARANLALARLGLAELALEAGDPAQARTHLAELDRLWPSPDPDLPAVKRRESLREKLGE